MAAGGVPGRREPTAGQQPDGNDAGDTPGVAAAPVAFAGAIMPGVARFIVTLSAQEELFGVGMTAMVGSMLVPASWVTSGSMVPGAGFAGICGVESGKAAPLVGGPPGVELHTVVEALPSGDIGDIVPVVLPAIGAEMVPGDDDVIDVDGIAVVALTMELEKAVAGIAGVGRDATAMEGMGRAANGAGAGAGTVEPGRVDRKDEAGCAESARKGAGAAAVVEGGGGGGTGCSGVGGEISAVAAGLPIADAVTGTASVGGPICPAGGAQVTAVPGIVGSEASGSGASVVSGTPGWVAAENGLGPSSGEDNIVPGVDERPMAVVPMVETCARPAWQPSSRAVAVNRMRRMAMASSCSSWSAPCCAPRPWRLPPGSPSG